jgi:site-specific DNA-cytosine methylase
MPGEPIKQIMGFSEVGYDVGYQVVYCEFGIPQTRRRVIIMGISKSRTRMRILLMAGILLQKNKIECFVGKYFEHLKEPDTTDDISQMVYSKAKRRKGGRVKPR